MAVVHIDGGPSNVDPNEVFHILFSRLRERYNIGNISLGPGSLDGNCGCYGLDELAELLGVEPEEISHDHIGIFIEAKSGNHYPLFEVTRRFLEALSNVVGREILVFGEGEGDGGNEEGQATYGQAIPQNQPRDEG